MFRVSEYIAYSYADTSGVKRIATQNKHVQFSVETASVIKSGVSFVRDSVCLDYRTRPESQFRRGRQDSRSGRCGAETAHTLPLLTAPRSTT